MRVVLLILSVLAALATPAVAGQASGLERLTSGADSRGWEGVGRLDIAGKSFCTGALIAPDLVLTAAHCLYDSDTGERVSADQIEYLAGFRNGHASARLGVRTAVPHPGFRFTGDDRVMRVSDDLALLRLSGPVANQTITPFAIAATPATGAEVGVVSYARERALTPAIQRRCNVVTRRDGFLVMDCDVDFGASGSPVFTMQNGRPAIVSVVSAKAQLGQRKVALGTPLDSGLATLRAALDKAESGVFANARHATGTRDAPVSGARFVRP